MDAYITDLLRRKIPEMPSALPGLARRGVPRPAVVPPGEAPVALDKAATPVTLPGTQGMPVPAQEAQIPVDLSQLVADTPAAPAPEQAFTQVTTARRAPPAMTQRVMPSGEMGFFNPAGKAPPGLNRMPPGLANGGPAGLGGQLPPGLGGPMPAGAMQALGLDQAQEFVPSGLAQDFVPPGQAEEFVPRGLSLDFVPPGREEMASIDMPKLQRFEQAPAAQAALRTQGIGALSNTPANASALINALRAR